MWSGFRLTPKIEFFWLAAGATSSSVDSGSETWCCGIFIAVQMHPLSLNNDLLEFSFALPRFKEPAQADQFPCFILRLAVLQQEHLRLCSLATSDQNFNILGVVCVYLLSGMAESCLPLHYKNSITNLISTVIKHLSAQNCKRFLIALCTGCLQKT